MSRRVPPDWVEYWERIRQYREGQGGKYLSREEHRSLDDSDAVQLGDKLYRYQGSGDAFRRGWIRLTDEEAEQGMAEGDARHENGRKRKDKFQTSPEQARAGHVLGRLAEIAYSLKTGIPCSSPNLKLDKHDADVGPWHVRANWDQGIHGLIMRSDDRACAPLVLMVCHRFPCFWVSVGWMLVSEGKQDRWYRDVKWPYWLVPRCELHEEEVGTGAPMTVVR